MRLSWNEIRVRAAKFVTAWKDASWESGETQSFYNDFFEVFGVARRSVARYEEHVRKLGNRAGYIDLFWPGVLMVEQKSVGRDLEKAYSRASEYFDALPERERPRYVLASDFQSFELHDLDETREFGFALEEFPLHVEKFGFIVGVQPRTFRNQDPVNIDAAEIVGALHDSLEESGCRGSDLERFLVRIVFCLFADHTGIFDQRGAFADFIETRTNVDGTGLDGYVAELFEVLSTPEARRQHRLDEDLASFPYVDGDLFREKFDIPAFDSAMRRQLLEACRFDWSKISPAIFGALFQSVMDVRQRRTQGAHYTTEQNILKVIEPLFLEDLKAELQRIKVLRRGRAQKLRAFQRKLGRLTIFDPACGCGNFLIISYRELRLLEIEVIRELTVATGRAGQRRLDATQLSIVNVDQFYGIEIGEFAVRIAETALWMMDHILNNQLSLEFGETYVRIPLAKSPHLICGDALEIDWSEILNPAACSFVLGNPPFGGFVQRCASKQDRTGEVIARLGATGGRLDYVTAWFLKAGEYFYGRSARIAFVATNSITQGEQVSQFWPALFGRYGLEIAFVHRTFPWGSDVRGAAHVHVVILGLTDRKSAPAKRRLFLYESVEKDVEEAEADSIGPYLVDTGRLRDPHLVVERRRSPLSGFPGIRVGTKPVDGGHYILDRDQRTELLEREPGAAKLIHPFLGGREHINGRKRWILVPSEGSASDLRSMPRVMRQVDAVRKYRASEAGNLGQSLADNPTHFHVTVIPDGEFLVIPEVSSERRKYVPIGYLKPPVIPSNQLLVVEDAKLHHFAILTSAMHMAWLRLTGGRLESRLRYSSGLVYNTFPVPQEAPDLSQLEPHAQAVLDARAAHPGESLAALYDPQVMPQPLRRAHAELDRAVDQLYRRSAFTSELERVEHLLSLYEQLSTPLSAGEGPRRRRKPSSPAQ